MTTMETQVSWQDYLAIVIRRRWVFAIPCAAIVAIAMVVGLFLPKIYRAETIMLVEDQNVINPLIQGLAISTPVGERMRTLREELLSWTSLSRLVTELKLDRQAKSPIAFERLVKKLQGDIVVRMRGKDLIAIAYENEDPKLAQTLVNTITTIYMDRNVQSQSAEAETAISFIESEMGVYKKKLEDSERSLREFKELYVMQMPVATELNKQIVDLEVTLAQLLVENTDEHPTVVSIRRRIKELKHNRNSEIKRVIASALAKGHEGDFFQDLAKALDEGTLTPAQAADPAIQAAKDAYTSWVSRLDAPGAGVGTQSSTGPQIQVVNAGPNGEMSPGSLDLLAGGNAALSLGPREEQELARLRRDYDVQMGTYHGMQERLERAKITQRLGESDEGTKFKVLEPARLPLRPIRPNLLKLFFFALTMGLFVGAGSAFLAEYLDQSFQSAEEVEAALALPVIGSISTIVTESDVHARRARRRGWISAKTNAGRLRTYVIEPVWARIDKALVRWGL